MQLTRKQVETIVGVLQRETDVDIIDVQTDEDGKLVVNAVEIKEILRRLPLTKRTANGTTNAKPEAATTSV